MAGLFRLLRSRKQYRVEFIVADAGIGIPKSLGIQDPRRALESSIQEGVTRNKKTNAGNGLYGSYRVAIISNGSFELQSYMGSLYSTPSAQLKIDRQKIPYNGTYVRCMIDCSHQNLLEEALIFSGKQHNPPFDYVERVFENSDSDEFLFKLIDQSQSFGSREAGAYVSNKLVNLLRDKGGAHIVMDFSGVNIISSSFADEVFGKLFVIIGPLEFMSRIKFINVDMTIKKLIDRAIVQRTTSYSS